MAKRAVIKQKLSRSRSKRRFASWRKKIQTKLLNRIHLVACPKCKEKRLSHTPCQNCGEYRGRKVFQTKEPELRKTKVSV